MEIEKPKPRSMFRRKRTGFVIGLFLGSGPGVFLGIYFGIPLGNFLLGDAGVYIYSTFFAVVGMCGGSIVGALGGYLGAFVAEKLARENLMFLFSIFGSIAFIGLPLVLLYLYIWL